MKMKNQATEGVVRCVACGRLVQDADMADQSRHETGGEAQCLACHEEVISGDSDLDCPGCRGRGE
jgi:DNA-directed RNA polymerase subunit RPC12/RpoP